jgi:predicted enzyme related to lactoylglutathione lyase
VPFKAKLCMFVMPAERDTLVKTAKLYSHIFGIEFSRTWTDQVKCLYAPISIDATMFSVEWRERGPGETGTPFPIFAVDDLDVAERELQELGGRLDGERFELPIAKQGLPKYRETMMRLGLHESQLTDRVGVARQMSDPSGNVFGLIQPDAHSQYAFKTGPYRIGMTAEQMAKWQDELTDTKQLGLGPV